MDVVVTDKKSQPVTGLKAEDFTIEENGKKQKVAVFIPPGLANQTAQVPVPPGVLDFPAIIVPQEDPIPEPPIGALVDFSRCGY